MELSVYIHEFNDLVFIVLFEQYKDSLFRLLQEIDVNLFYGFQINLIY